MPYRKGTFDYKSLNEKHIQITDKAYGQTWNLSLCLNCRYIFANPSPHPSFIQTLYSGVKDPHYEEEAEGRGKNFRRILSRLNRIHPEKGRLFDVGAATGILLHIAHQQGWTPSGIEASSWAVKMASHKYKINLMKGSFETAPIPSNQFNVVTMVDFIEHTPSPYEALQKAYHILEPGGTLCVVTPDIFSFAARVMGRRWWHIRPAHIGYFGRESLESCLNRAGFSVFHSRKYSWTFSVHYLLSRLDFTKFLIKKPHWASFWKRFSIKLILLDSLEVYARKELKT